MFLELDSGTRGLWSVWMWKVVAGELLTDPCESKGLFLYLSVSDFSAILSLTLVGLLVVA